MPQRRRGGRGIGPVRFRRGRWRSGSNRRWPRCRGEEDENEKTDGRDGSISRHRVNGGGSGVVEGPGVFFGHGTLRSEYDNSVPAFVGAAIISHGLHGFATLSGAGKSPRWVCAC